MNNGDIINILMGIAIGLFVAYFFLWGATYSELKQENNQLRQDYELLQKECGEVLKAYNSCVGREDFFTWIDRFMTLRNLAKLAGIPI